MNEKQIYQKLKTKIYEQKIEILTMANKAWKFYSLGGSQNWHVTRLLIDDSTVMESHVLSFDLVHKKSDGSIMHARYCLTTSAELLEKDMPRCRYSSLKREEAENIWQGLEEALRHSLTKTD
ncbi:hypothetical protein CL633_00695 [bacterium]|nr:hypothetical protein [bacterium]|tara:strand:- start:6059 stop:6424 length:366 start_codon:yes stop_codon:yes gene_type:complete